MQEINRQLTLIAQLVVSVVTAFIAGYLLPYFFYGVQDRDIRIIIGILFAFAVGVADLYFILRYFLKVDGVISVGDKKKLQ